MLKFSTEPVKPATEDNSLSSFDFAQMKGELMSVYEGLTDSIRELYAVEELMDNVGKSLDLLSKYGAAAIPQLNLDKGLESLLNVKENLITVEKAVEALDGQQKNIFKKFWDGLVAIVTKIIDFFRVASQHDGDMCKRIANAKSFNAVDVKEYTMVSADAMEDYIALWNDGVTLLDELQTYSGDGKSLTELSNECEKVVTFAKNHAQYVSMNTKGGIILDPKAFIKTGTLETLGFKTVEDAQKFATSYHDLAVVKRHSNDGTLNKFKLALAAKSAQNTQDIAKDENERSVLRLQATYYSYALSIMKLQASLYSKSRYTMFILMKHCENTLLPAQ